MRSGRRVYMHGLCVVFKVRRGAENLECRFRLRLRLFRFLIYVVGFAVWGELLVLD